MKVRFAIISVLATTLFVAGCGGGGDDGDSSSSQNSAPPPQAKAYNTDHLKSDNAVTVHVIGEKGDGVVIGIFDTGVEKTSAEFDSDRLLEGFDATKDDGDQSHKGNAYTDSQGHGTGVASLAFGKNLGVAPEATGVSYKVTNDERDISYENELEAVQAAYDRGNVKVLNVSSGIDLDLDNGRNKLRQLVIKGIENQGWVLVVAAGNNDGNNVSVDHGGFADDPAFHGQVIAVGAGDGKGNLASYSAIATSNFDMLENYGDVSGVVEHFLIAPGEVSVAAPVSMLESGYNQLSGTSFAAPQVAGAVAVVMSAYPSLTSEQVVEVLLKSATKRDGMDVNDITGSGKLNLSAAIHLAQKYVDNKSS